jgi:hypothetical protein
LKEETQWFPEQLSNRDNQLILERRLIQLQQLSLDIQLNLDNLLIPKPLLNLDKLSILRRLLIL